MEPTEIWHTHPKSKPMATFIVLVNGKPKLDPFLQTIPETDPPDDTIDETGFARNFTKLDRLPCEFDPAEEVLPKDTILIYNTKASEDVKLQDKRVLAKEPQPPEKNIPKALDYIKLNKQIVRYLNKSKSKLESGKTTPRSSPRPARTIHISPSRSIRSSSTDYQNPSKTGVSPIIIARSPNKSGKTSKKLTFRTATDEHEPSTPSATVLPRQKDEGGIRLHDPSQVPTNSARVFATPSISPAPSDDIVAIPSIPRISSDEMDAIRNYLKAEEEENEIKKQREQSEVGQEQRKCWKRFQRQRPLFQMPECTSSMTLNLSPTCSDDSSVDCTE